MDLLNKLTNSANQAGVYLFWLGTMTNDIDATFTDDAPCAPTATFEQRDITFEAPSDSSLTLDFQDTHEDDEEQAIVNFASKFLSASKDIEPEINAVVQKDLWEIL